MLHFPHGLEHSRDLKNTRLIEDIAVQCLNSLSWRRPVCSEERQEGRGATLAGGDWGLGVGAARFWDGVASSFPSHGSNGSEFTMFASDNPKHASQKPTCLIPRARACVEEGGAPQSSMWSK